MQKTALNSQHHALGAKMVEFSGWEMPLSYQGILAEHLAVRNTVGIFDLSHMGRIDVEGADAEQLLESLSTNIISGKMNGSATYTVWINAEGGSVDDLIVYRQSPTQFFVIVNASNRDKDLKFLEDHAQKLRVEITPRYNDGILAIQGPQAPSMVSHLFPSASVIKPMHFEELIYDGEQLILSATGYTGSGGFEILASEKIIKQLWHYFVDQEKIPPIGLGARDTLRLEMGYALYGHELSDTISPPESVSAWTVKKALPVLEKRATKRYAYGVVLLEKGIAREGNEVLSAGEEIGYVTSGTYSPSLQKAIALILVNKKLTAGSLVEVQIRSQACPAQVVKLPFVKIEK